MNPGLDSRSYRFSPGPVMRTHDPRRHHNEYGISPGWKAVDGPDGGSEDMGAGSPIPLHGVARDEQRAGPGRPPEMERWDAPTSTAKTRPVPHGKLETENRTNAALGGKRSESAKFRMSPP